MHSKPTKARARAAAAGHGQNAATDGQPAGRQSLAQRCGGARQTHEGGVRCRAPGTPPFSMLTAAPGAGGSGLEASGASPHFTCGVQGPAAAQPHVTARPRSAPSQACRALPRVMPWMRAARGGGGVPGRPEWGQRASCSCTVLGEHPAPHPAYTSVLCARPSAPGPPGRCGPLKLSPGTLCLCPLTRWDCPPSPAHPPR